MVMAAGVRPRPGRRGHHRLWPVQRDRLRRWPAQRRLRPWLDPPRRRSGQLPRRSGLPWPHIRRRVSLLRRDQPRRTLLGHDPRSIVPRRRNDRP